MHEWHQSQIDSYMGCSSLYLIYYRSYFLNICPLVVGQVLFTELVRNVIFLRVWHSKTHFSLIAQAPRRLAQASAQSLKISNCLFQMDCAGCAKAPRRLAYITIVDSFETRRLA